MSKTRTTLLVLGLGNPGSAYERTRHNVGFRVVENLASELGITLRYHSFKSYRSAILKVENKKIILVQPFTFMNRSGEILRSLSRRYYFEIEDLVVVLDNLDLPPGNCRLKRGGGHGGHRGLQSLIKNLSNADFLRLYIGIGHPGHRSKVEKHVLSSPSSDEKVLLKAGVDRAVKALQALIVEEPKRVMEELNRRAP